MRIGIDIDGVLTDEDNYRLEKTAKFIYENDLEDMIDPYNYEHYKCNWDPVIKQKFKTDYFLDYCENVKPRLFASEVIKKLHDDGHTIVIITGRYKTTEDSPIGESMRKGVVDWLSKYQIIYDKIWYAKMPKTKELVENRIDIMIDDSPVIAKDIVEVCKLYLFDNRYNQNIILDHMERVFGFYDIYRKIEKEAER